MASCLASLTQIYVIVKSSITLTVKDRDGIGDLAKHTPVPLAFRDAAASDNLRSSEDLHSHLYIDWHALNSSFEDVFQAILLTSRGRKDFPQACQNGLKQGLLELFSAIKARGSASRTARSTHLS
jgi:hypothetical protein